MRPGWIVSGFMECKQRLFFCNVCINNIYKMKYISPNAILINITILYNILYLKYIHDKKFGLRERMLMLVFDYNSLSPLKHCFLIVIIATIVLLSICFKPFKMNIRQTEYFNNQYIYPMIWCRSVNIRQLKG